MESLGEKDPLFSKSMDHAIDSKKTRFLHGIANEHGYPILWTLTTPGINVSLVTKCNYLLSFLVRVTQLTNQN